MKAHRFVFAVFAVSQLTLSPLASYSKNPLVFYRFDGTFLLITAEKQKTWELRGWNFTTNPLEGLGGLALPQQALLDPGLWLTAHLLSLAGPVVAMTVYAAALAAAICWLGMRVAVFATSSRRERTIKVACGIGFAGLALIVFGRLLYGLWGFSKATFFWYEFFPRPADLRDQSFLIADHSNWPAWLVYGLSLAGALVAACSGPPILRTFARGFLIFVLGELVVVLVTSQGG
jgi:hypothetical protein